VTFGGRSGMRRLLSSVSSASGTGEAKGHRPGPSTRALPSMAGRGRGERGESPALGSGNTTPPRRRKHGSWSQKSSRWSAERRGIPRKDAADRARCGHSAPVGAPPFSLCWARGEGLKAHPAPFQTIRAAQRCCLIIESGAELLGTCAPHIPSSPPGLTRRSTRSGHVRRVRMDCRVKPGNDEGEGRCPGQARA
jgi:hypothetical protein